MKKSVVKKVGAIIIGASAILAIPSNSAQAFGFGSVGLGGGSEKKTDVNWGDLASVGQKAEINIYSGTRLMALSTQTMADALGLKDEAAALNGQIQKMNKDGTVSGGFDLGETTKISASVLDKVVSDKDKLANLDKATKDKISESLKQYAIGGIQYILGLKEIKDVAQKASGAPMMQAGKFVGIIKLAPTVATGATHLFGKIPQVIKVATAADIKVPEDMSKVVGDF